jgi:Fe-S cluster biogenesis protein NfuA
MNVLAHDSAELLERVERALDNIRPFLQFDNGDVRVLGITENMVVQVELLGACSTCRMSSMTMKAGVEEALRNAIPAISAVEAVNSLETA